MTYQDPHPEIPEQYARDLRALSIFAEIQRELVKFFEGSGGKMIPNAPDKLFLTWNQYGSIETTWHLAESPLQYQEPVAWYVRADIASVASGEAESAGHLRRESILDIPEHERRFPSHPDTLRGKEEKVIEAAIEYDLRAYEHLQAAHPRSECDLPACIAWWQAGDKLSNVTRALIAARKDEND